MSSKLTLFSAVMFTSFFSFSSFAAKSMCTYTIDPATLHVNWTAFKKMQKVGVNGSFTEVTLESDLSKKGTLQDLLNQIDAEIKIDSATKLSTTNPARDKTIFDNFFSQFANGGLVHGRLQNAKGNDSKGVVNLVLKMNDKSLAVQMKYIRDVKGVTTISGGIDVNDFGLTGALAKLHQACELLHKGPDGVSKTWPQVEIKIDAAIAKTCP